MKKQTSTWTQETGLIRAQNLLRQWDEERKITGAPALDVMIAQALENAYRHGLSDGRGHVRAFIDYS